MRRLWQGILLLIGCTSVLVLSDEPAVAIQTPYYCDEFGNTRPPPSSPPGAGCKYGMAKAGYGKSSSFYTVDALLVRGGTASPPCDPSNTVYQWAMDGSRGQGDDLSAFLYSRQTSAVPWRRDRTNYRENCDVDAAAALWNFPVNASMFTDERPAFEARMWHRTEPRGQNSGFATRILVPIP